MNPNKEKQHTHQLFQRLDSCMIADKRLLSKRLHALSRRLAKQQDVQRGLQDIERKVSQSQQRYQQRQAQLPKISYPESLPVSSHRDEIAAAIQAHQVVIIAGETGSGKTTQIPKICLELGRGIGGIIGHTQPRRIAARSVATRIAQELESQVGEHVGYKVRFSDKSQKQSYIKLMTDGILLAEIQGDSRLEQYDTIIIDNVASTLISYWVI